MLVAMQKLLQLPAYIRDSSSSTTDVPLKAPKEPQSVVQSPASDLTPQNVRSSTTWTSLFSQPAPTKVPAHPVLEERLSPAAMPNANPSRQTLKRGPSPMLRSCSNDKRHAQKLGLSDHSLTSRRSSSDVGHRTGLEKLWSASDTFLPHAKPPAPLPNQLQRNCSEQTLMIPLSPTTATRASKPRFETWGQLSKARSMTFQSSRQVLEGTPIPDIPHEQYKMLAQRVQQSLTQPNNQITTTFSGESDESTRGWKPPPSWAGPSAVTSADEGKETRPTARSKLTSRKRTQSSPRLGVRERVGIPQRSKTSEPFHLVDIVKPGEETSSARGRPSTEVKIRYYEGWHEKPVGDVVHMLRELRFK